MLFNIPADLIRARIEAQTSIDKQIGDARSLFITLVPGQEAVYALKLTEAQLIAADRDRGDKVPNGETPHITAEAAEHGVSRFEKAVEILTRDQRWKVGSQMIEAIRRSATTTLKTAQTAPEIRAAYDIDWREVCQFART
ncbi:hypothetical protein HGP17_07150 [Rhizobium sp. P38BS-XIX]|uniref:hypothetical protein n=1 Tax=Rhizobium sp. P38BS-XIX TaxID=2726740 RepID=UPI001456EEA1|nr:hypothetical protein [Rhizobium sp. P38BS-XIX]NLR96607.1 hypothetical protein [Rhizobium sp. P38BS-XIX]